MLEFKVNQATLLRNAVVPIAAMAAEANISYSPNGLTLQSADTDHNVSVVLLIKSENVDNIICNDQEGYARINPRSMLEILDFLDGEEEWSISVSIYGEDDDDEGHGFMRFVFQNATQGITRSHVMQLLNAVPGERLHMNDLQYEMSGLVGISSQHFSQYLMLLSYFGTSVNVCITENQLKLSTMNKEIVLTRGEDPGFIIQGIAENYPPIRFSFGLEHRTSIRNALLLSDMVGLLIPAHFGDPFMLNCPAGELGSVMFLLHSD